MHYTERVPRIVGTVTIPSSGTAEGILVDSADAPLDLQWRSICAFIITADPERVTEVWASGAATDAEDGFTRLQFEGTDVDLPDTGAARQVPFNINTFSGVRRLKLVQASNPSSDLVIKVMARGAE